jgi:hypothetical protein
MIEFRRLLSCTVQGEDDPLFVRLATVTRPEKIEREIRKTLGN